MHALEHRKLLVKALEGALVMIFFTSQPVEVSKPTALWCGAIAMFFAMCWSGFWSPTLLKWWKSNEKPIFFWNAPEPKNTISQICLGDVLWTPSHSRPPGSEIVHPAGEVTLADVFCSKSVGWWWNDFEILNSSRCSSKTLGSSRLNSSFNAQKPAFCDRASLGCQRHRRPSYLICCALEMGLSEASGPGPTDPSPTAWRYVDGLCGRICSYTWSTSVIGLIARDSRLTHIALGEFSSTPGALVLINGSLVQAFNKDMQNVANFTRPARFLEDALNQHAPVFHTVVPYKLHQDGHFRLCRGKSSWQLHSVKALAPELAWCFHRFTIIPDSLQHYDRLSFMPLWSKGQRCQLSPVMAPFRLSRTPLNR